MQMIIFHQSYFFGITVSFHNNISKKGAQKQSKEKLMSKRITSLV